MNETDKLIARMGFQLVQYELAIMELQKQLEEARQQLSRALTPQPDAPSQGIAFPQA